MVGVGVWVGGALSVSTAVSSVHFSLPPVQHLPGRGAVGGAVAVGRGRIGRGPGKFGRRMRM